MNENAGSGSDDEDEGQGEGQGEEPLDAPKKRAGSEKRAKKKNLPIHETKMIAPSEPVPADSVLKGHTDFIVQDIRFETYICYRRKRPWSSIRHSRVCGNPRRSATALDSGLRRNDGDGFVTKAAARYGLPPGALSPKARYWAD